MTTKYYQCPDRADLMKVIPFEGNYYEDGNLIIDVVGHVDLNPPIELQEGEVDEREPLMSDFLFNVRFKNEVTNLFDSFEEKTPTTPIRTFL